MSRTVRGTWSTRNGLDYFPSIPWVLVRLLLLRPILGDVDLLVNICGGFKPTKGEPPKGLSVIQLPEERWADTFDLNLQPSVHLVKQLAPQMLERGYGRIVNIASVAAASSAYSADYGAAKAAVMSFTRSLAIELAPAVIVNCIAPGPINTTVMQRFSEKGRQNAGRGTTLKRVGQPEDIANACCFLCSSECSYMTGECLRISGGLQANL